MDGVTALLARAAEAAVSAGLLAARVHRAATRTRAVAARAGAVQDTPWTSPAADSFRTRTEVLPGQLQQAADEVDEAGRALRAHAHAATARAEHLASLARSLEEAVAQGVDDVVRRASEALDGALPQPWRRP